MKYNWINQISPSKMSHLKTLLERHKSIDLLLSVIDVKQESKFTTFPTLLTVEMLHALWNARIRWKILVPCRLQAVCCADHEHCCPQGYTCNMQTGTCEKKNHGELFRTLPLSKVVQSEPRDTEDDADIPCDSAGEFHCPERDTCCKISASEWACCPSPRVRPRVRPSS